jgi:hypothetical protein
MEVEYIVIFTKMYTVFLHLVMQMSVLLQLVMLMSVFLQLVMQMSVVTVGNAVSLQRGM